MRVPISIELPSGMNCRSLPGVGHWIEGRQGTQRTCPDLTVVEGLAESYFDQGGRYDDNEGNCTYRFVCKPSNPVVE